MLRLKKNTSFGAELMRPLTPPPPPRLLGPNLKIPEFSRKNSRFSGKNRLNRVRLICCSSASTWEKSVLYVKSQRQAGRDTVLRIESDIAFFLVNAREFVLRVA